MKFFDAVGFGLADIICESIELAFHDSIMPVQYIRQRRNRRVSRNVPRHLREFVAQSDQGGDDDLSEARRSIIRRVACLQTELELLETRFAKAGGAEASDLDLYQRTSANLRRLLDVLELTECRAT